MDIMEHSFAEVLQVLFLNGAVGVIASLIHGTIYFSLGWTYWALHCFHYLSTFLFLLLLLLLGFVEKKFIPIKHVTQLAIAEALVSIFTCCIHNGGSEGTLNSIRVVDFGFTILVMYISSFYFEPQSRIIPQNKPFVVRNKNFSYFLLLENKSFF